MLKIVFLLALLLCPNFGVSSATESRSHVGDEAQIRLFVATFIRAFDDLDWTKFRACFADDATVFYPEFFPRRVEGATSLDQTWQRVFENIKVQSGKSQAPYMDLKPSGTQVQMLSNAAIVTFHLNHGGTAVGRRTLVLRKGAPGWRIVHLHASNIDFGTKGK